MTVRPSAVAVRLRPTARPVPATSSVPAAAIRPSSAGLLPAGSTTAATKSSARPSTARLVPFTPRAPVLPALPAAAALQPTPCPVPSLVATSSSPSSLVRTAPLVAVRPSASLGLVPVAPAILSSPLGVQQAARPSIRGRPVPTAAIPSSVGSLPVVAFRAAAATAPVPASVPLTSPVVAVPICT